MEFSAIVSCEPAETAKREREVETKKHLGMMQNKAKSRWEMGQQTLLQRWIEKKETKGWDLKGAAAKIDCWKKRKYIQSA